MKSHIPTQHEGGKLDISAKSVFTTSAAAKEFYTIARKRLLDVSDWGTICKVPVSVFTLTDSSGNKLTRLAREGDFVKIDIPGPGPLAGDGYDWVQLEKIVEETEETAALISIQARPSENPSGESNKTAHFFKDIATSTFQMKWNDREVIAEEHGRNEVPETDSSSGLDNLRNRLVGWSAKIGLSYPQWKSLVKGIVDTDQ